MRIFGNQLDATSIEEMKGQDIDRFIERQQEQQLAAMCLSSKSGSPAVFVVRRERRE